MLSNDRNVYFHDKFSAFFFTDKAVFIILDDQSSLELENHVCLCSI